MTFTAISDEAAATGHHPIAIWSSGTPFDGPQDKSGLRQQRRLGLQVYKRFLNLIRQLQPSYAAITIEAALDLRRDPSGYAFRNLDVTTRYLGPRLTKQFHGLFPGAYREAVAEGWYISCWEAFNPQGKNVAWKNAGEDSLTMAKLIARAAR